MAGFIRGNPNDLMTSRYDSTVPFTAMPVFSVPSFELAGDLSKRDFVETMSWQITVLGFIASLSIAINLSTCFVHMRFRGRRSNFSSVILAISSLDILFVAAQLGIAVATFADPSNSQSRSEDDKNGGFCASGSIACRLAILLPIIFLLLESAFLAVGSFNRWLAIAKPEVPHWVKGRTCLIGIMTVFLVATIAVGINMIRDDIIMLKPTKDPKSTTPTPAVVTKLAQNETDSGQLVGLGLLLSDQTGNLNQSSPSLAPTGTSSNLIGANGAHNGDDVFGYYSFGCSVVPSMTAIGVISGVIVFYCVLIAISMTFLVVTWFHIWSVLPLPTADGSRSLKTMALRRNPQFVNSKFVDGYKIMWATLVLWIACSVCALAVTFAPVTAASNYTCLTRRFIAVALYFLATLFKCLIYVAFSFTFRRAIVETFVAPCCSRFYRTQNYAVSRSSPFDRHVRIAVVGGQPAPVINFYTRPHRHKHRHHHNGASSHRVPDGAGDLGKTSSNGVIPTVLVPDQSQGSGSIFFTPSRRSKELAPGAFSDPGACFDLEGPEYPDDNMARIQMDSAPTSNSSSVNGDKKSKAYLSPMVALNANTYGFGFTSIVSLPSRSSHHHHRSSEKKQSSGESIPVQIDDISGGSYNANRRSHLVRSSSPRNTGSSNRSYREDVSSSDVLVSSTLSASPQPTVSPSMVFEDENKL